MEYIKNDIVLDEDFCGDFNESNAGDTGQHSTLNSTKNYDDQAPDRCHLEVLRKEFGHTEFRPMQWKIIRSILYEKRDNCIIMATGYGKSLCYQFPPVFQKGLAVVISPLISLMEDQVQALEVADIPACFLGSAQINKGGIMEDLMAGVYRLVYITPEYASGEYGLEILPKLHKAVNITLLAIDEAHCVSQWGHDFRPAYRSLGALRRLLPSVPILAVTATATLDVREDIVKSLGLKSPQVLCTGFDRPNIYFKVEKKSDPFTDISNVLFREKKLYSISNGSVIIYCLTKKITESVVELLKSKDIKCEAYHAGLSIKVRRQVHEKFVKDEIRIIVATIAFGMGIDKPNVRCVIHYGSSSDMEGYYQEAGRAGRDGNPSLCILFNSPADFITHSFLRERSKLSASARAHKESLNTVMKNYVSTCDCRRHFILSYFDKNLQPKATPQTNCCDNCTKKALFPKDSTRYEGMDAQGKFDLTEDAEKFLLAIDCFLPRSFGTGMVISLLKGSKSKKLNSSYFSHKIYGAGSSKSEGWWKEIAWILEREKFVKKENRKMGLQSFPVIILHTRGEKWLEEKNRGVHKPILLMPTADMMSYLKTKKNVEPLFSKDLNNKVPADNSRKTIPSSSSSALDDQDMDRQLNEYEDDLMKELCNLRHALAQKQSIIPHTIASDVALQQMARKRPLSLQQLANGNFHGMSEHKIEKFGQHFISALIKYCNGHPQTISEILLSHPMKMTAVNSIYTFNVSQETSYEMFKKGMDVKQIAETRNLAPSTINTHLVCALRKGCELDLNRLISASNLHHIILIIQSDLLKNDMSKLTPIKNHCNPAITYDEIKLAIGYLEIRQHINAMNFSYVDDYALEVENRKVVFKSVTVLPKSAEIKKEEAPKCKFISDISKFQFKSSVKSKYTDFISNDGLPPYEPNTVKSNKIPDDSNDMKSNEIIPVNDDDIWGDDDMLENNFDQIDEILSRSFDEKIIPKSSSEKNIEQEDLLLKEESGGASNQNTECKVPSVDTKKSELEKLGEKSDKSVAGLKSKKSMYDSDSGDEKEPSASNIKRKLPDWMNDADKMKGVMKKKMSQNRLFN